MTSTMPHDKLGRIVYVGDVLEDGAIVTGILPTGLEVALRGSTGGPFPASSETVDIDASPCLTNYERYFADLGTFEAVLDAVDDDCFRHECRTCVFDGWGMRFGTVPADCHGFGTWLDERAVI